MSTLVANRINPTAYQTDVSSAAVDVPTELSSKLDRLDSVISRLYGSAANLAMANNRLYGAVPQSVGEGKAPPQNPPVLTRFEDALTAMESLDKIFASELERLCRAV